MTDASDYAMFFSNSYLICYQMYNIFLKPAYNRLELLIDHSWIEHFHDVSSDI